VERPPAPRRARPGDGRAQLSLVEHALCPLDPAASLVPNLVHESHYGYTDKNGHAKEAQVRIHAPFGLSASDEFVLWGLLALTFAQAEPEPELQATPHYCLRRLGIIPDNARKGGKSYRLFRESVRRLSGVLYASTAFYDPVRGERRDVAFGLLKYSLPLDPSSSRAWRILWDQQFFELCAASGGSLHFDLETYRGLDAASRRLFVLLQKIFWRHDASPTFDVRHLAVDVIGFASTLPPKTLKARVGRCADRLLAAGVLRLPPGAASSKDLFVKRGVGEYALTFHRGPYFDRPEKSKAALAAADSPLVDPLRAIGFDDAGVGRLLKAYPARLLREWADITLAARERNGAEFFSKSAAAYFLANVKHAAGGRRTAPDWWRQLRAEELRRGQEHKPVDGVVRGDAAGEEAFRRYLETEAREAYAGVYAEIHEQLIAATSDPREAEERATLMARMHLRNRFRREHPEWSGAGPDRLDLASLLKRRTS